MIIDAHYHVEERLLPIAALLKKMDDAEVQQTVLIGNMMDPFPEPAPFLVRLLQILLRRRALRPIGKALVAQFTPEGAVKILGKAYPVHPDPDNLTVFTWVDRYPDRFRGWVFVNPKGRRDPLEELQRWREHPGFVGVKAHPFWHRYPPALLLPVAQQLAALEKPLLIHAGFGSDGDFDALLKQVPTLRLILAHTGFPRYGDTWKAIQSQQNVCVDLSQTSYVSPAIIRDAVAALGVERCLFGTDGPYGFHGSDGVMDYGRIKGWIERLFSDAGVRRLLLGENLIRIAGLS